MNNMMGLTKLTTGEIRNTEDAVAAIRDVEKPRTKEGKMTNVEDKRGGVQIIGPLTEIEGRTIKALER